MIIKIAETECNLRQLFFLCDIRTDIQRDGTHADVTIYVRDLYARALSPQLSSESDELSYGLVGLDLNFLGRGRILATLATAQPFTIRIRDSMAQDGR